MSTKKQSKKLNKFTTSPLIAVIAIIEVIILVCACTFAWFVFTKNTTISTEFLSVEPDSGLEIDFNTADENDFVVINQYILDNFEFEPVTSTDGRNIFVPTTGSFGNDTTEQLAFREATVNDMNQKYICIDFTLSNTGEEAMPVYLSPRSSFTVAGKEGKALRLAFYQNDGSSGDIDATYYQSDNADDNVVTVFFKNTNNWEHPYAYAYSNADGDNNKSHNMDWPGVPITHISGDLYYYTFSTKYTVGGDAFNNELNRIIFSNGKETNRQTDNRGIYNNYIYTASTETNDKGEFLLERELYTSSIVDGTYPIVSPGVSVGFQRQYAPVTNIDNTTGAATAILPAYANSIDNYSYGSTPLFTIGSFKTMSLSMIVWLEGTDPACTSENYSGSEIDINLIFATKDSDENYSRYTFYDKTLETWIAHETPSATGQSVKPVMQLYDLTIDKGYLMKPSEYFTDSEGNTRAKTWYCDAPDEIISDNHDVVFRRVNPLDENEIWNFWDARGADKTSATKVDGANDTSALPDGITDNYYFTALADGSPVEVKIDNNGNKTPDLPTYSCGGLWGSYTTETVRLYDGSKDYFIKDSSGVLTMNYTYDGQPVEYKGSGPDNVGRYTFVMPKIFIGKNSSGLNNGFVIKRYYNFDTGYAINISEKQPDLTYHDSWELSYCKGHFIQLNQTRGGTNTLYWGDDLQYVQVSEYNDVNGEDQSSKFDSDNYHMQICYYTASGQKFYSYIYKNDAVKGSLKCGYVSVIPSDKSYVKYRIERCEKNDPTNMYNATSKYEIDSITKSTYYSNTVTDNICILDYFKFNVYYTPIADGSTVKLNAHRSSDTHTEQKEMVYDSDLGLYYSEWNISLFNKFDIKETLPSSSDYVYLLPNSNWLDANARFAAYFFDNDKDTNTWVNATEVGDTGIYKVKVPSAYKGKGMIWGRMNPEHSTNNWTNCWNQTVDLTVPSDANRLYYVKSDMWNDSPSHYWTDTFQSKVWDFSDDTDYNHNGMTFEPSVDYDSYPSNSGLDITVNLNKIANNDVDGKEDINVRFANNETDIW